MKKARYVFLSMVLYIISGCSLRTEGDLEGVEREFHKIVINIGDSVADSGFNYDSKKNIIKMTVKLEDEIGKNLTLSVNKNSIYYEAFKNNRDKLVNLFKEDLKLLYCSLDSEYGFKDATTVFTLLNGENEPILIIKNGIVTLDLISLNPELSI